jgi:Domain of unknown function (DUF4917)
LGVPDHLEVLSFQDALKDAGLTPKRHVLLGNGFSIDCRPAIFTYKALLEEADFSATTVDMKEVFRLLDDTADFELVIQALERASLVLSAYDPPNGPVRQAMSGDAKEIKAALANVLAGRHPDMPSELSTEELNSAATFTGLFDHLYTLNYDLLLYWVVMHALNSGQIYDDGFRNNDGTDFIVWDPYATFRNQNVFYLHGALHLYDHGTMLEKFTWTRSGVRLITQIRESLDAGRYPLIVTEGTSHAKQRRMLHSAYLNHAMRSLFSIQGTLFIFGHSLAANDQHILERIPAGKLRAIYVSIYGDPSTHANQAIVAAGRALASQRTKGAQLELKFFDAESAHAWR